MRVRICISAYCAQPLPKTAPVLQRYCCARCPERSAKRRKRSAEDKPATPAAALSEATKRIDRLETRLAQARARAERYRAEVAQLRKTSRAHDRSVIRHHQWAIADILRRTHDRRDRLVAVTAELREVRANSVDRSELMEAAARIVRLERQLKLVTDQCQQAQAERDVARDRYQGLLAQAKRAAAKMREYERDRKQMRRLIEQWDRMATQLAKRVRDGDRTLTGPERQIVADWMRWKKATVAGQKANVLLRDGGLINVQYRDWTLAIAVDASVLKGDQAGQLTQLAELAMARAIKNG